MTNTARRIQQQQTRRSRKVFATGALAASLLVVPSMSLLHQRKNPETLARAVLHSLEEQPALSVTDLKACHREITQKLQSKTVRYHALSAKLSGTDSPIASTVLNMRINEVRQIQSQIMKAKEELVEINVQRAVAEQHARSPSWLEQAVAQALDEDPMLANYKAEEYTLTQQIRTLKAGVVQPGGTSANIKRLHRALEALQQEAQKYRHETEAKLRTTLKNAPDNRLSKMMTGFILRRDFITEKITKLEKEYKEKVAKIEQMGSPSGELSLLQTEIEQLQAVEQHLDDVIRSRSDR